jgi:hypothetical protein
MALDFSQILVVGVSLNPDSAIEKNHYFYALNPNA